MKLLLLLSLLAVTLQQTSAAKLQRGNFFGSYLQPIGSIQESRCALVTITSTASRTTVIIQPVTADVTLVTTVPVIDTQLFAVTHTARRFFEKVISTYTTNVLRGVETAVVTHISLVNAPPVIQTSFVYVTSTSTTTNLHQFSTSTKIYETNVNTRTELITELSIDAVYQTKIQYIKVPHQHQVATVESKQILSIPIDRTRSPVYSTVAETSISTKIETAYVTPQPIIKSSSEYSTTISYMSELIPQYQTTTVSVPMYSTYYDTVFQTVTDTATAISYSSVYIPITKTVEKVIPTTYVVPIIQTKTVTVERRLTSEVVKTSIRTAVIEQTSRLPEQTIVVVSTVTIWNVGTQTIEDRPATLTMIATVSHQCGTVTVPPQEYTYDAPSQ